MHNEEINIIGLGLLVAFSDTIRGHEFDHTIHCRCVRRVPHKETGMYLYGCQIINLNRDILAYISLKTMNMQAEETEKKRKQAAALAGEAKHVIDM